MSFLNLNYLSHLVADFASRWVKKAVKYSSDDKNNHPVKAIKLVIFSIKAT